MGTKNKYDPLHDDLNDVEDLHEEDQKDVDYEDEDDLNESEEDEDEDELKEEDEDEDEDEVDESVEDPTDFDGEHAPEQAAGSVKKATQAVKKTNAPLKGAGKGKEEPELKAAAFKEDLDALVRSESTLSENFRAKAEVIFESALNARVSEHVNRLEDEYSTNLEEATSAIKKDLIEKVDGYLNYVVETWMSENALAIESGLRTEVTESFISALHGVFESHYVEVPKGKTDLFDDLANQVDSLKEELRKSVSGTLELREKLDEMTRKEVIGEAAYGLSEAQKEKLKTLAESIDFSDRDSFAEKVSMIKESYFPNTVVKESSDDGVESSSSGESISASPLMEKYLAALKK